MFEVSFEFFLKIIGLYPSRFLHLIQLVHISIEVILSIYNHYTDFSINNPKFNIFFIVDIFQTEVFILLQIYIYYRVHKLKSTNFYEKIFKYFKWRLSKKSQKRFTREIWIIVITRIIRYLLYVPNSNSFSYSFAVASAELVVSSSGLLVALFFTNLIEKQKLLKYQILNKIKLNTFDKKISEMIKMEQKILKTFSHELVITIAYNYFQMLTCLYWLFIRVTHNRLRIRSGELKIHIYISNEPFLLHK